MTIQKAGKPRRQWRRLQLLFAGAAALATLGGFAADDSDDQAQLQFQQDMQQAQIDEQQANNP